MSVQIFIPNLAPVNPSLKKSQNLKVSVEIDHTEHNIQSFDDSETRQQTLGGYPSDHNTICLFSSLVFDKGFFLRQNWYWFGLQVTKAASADACPNLHSKLGASPSFSQRITRSCVPLMVAGMGYN
jgi:hypothetical protein